MADKIISFNQSIFYGKFAIDQRFIEKYLIPGLKKPKFLTIDTQGIELPTGEYISPQEAKDILLDWLTLEGNLPTETQEELKKTTSYKELGEGAEKYFIKSVKQPTSMATTARLNNLEQLQKSQPTATKQSKQFDSKQIIQDYNRIYQKVLLYANSDSSAAILRRLFPTGVSKASQMGEYQLAQIIAENIVRLRSAGSLGTSPEAQDRSFANEFGSILSESYSKNIGYNSFLGDQNTQRVLHQLVDDISNAIDQDDPTLLKEYESVKWRAGQLIESQLLNESELSVRLTQALTFIPKDEDRKKIATNILRETIKSSYNNQKIEDAIGNLKLKDPEKSAVYNALDKSGLLVSLEYRLVLEDFNRSNIDLTRREARLAQKRGISPFLAAKNLSAPKLAKNEKQILDNYNKKYNQSFNSLNDAYLHELSKDNFDPLFIAQARNHLNYSNYYQSLSNAELFQLKGNRLFDWIGETRDKIYQTQNHLIDTWIDFEETITGKKWLNKQLARWENFKDNFTVKIGNRNIPIFRLRNWLLDQFDSWKKKTALNAISKTSGWTNPFGKFIHLRLKDYELGRFTIKGASFVMSHRALSWVAYKASGKIIKGGAILTQRTLTRLLIKVGGKALAKLGIEAIATLSGVFSAIGILLIIKDLAEFVIKGANWLWEKFKNLFPNTEGAIAGAITGLASIWTVSLAFVTGLFSAPLSAVVIPIVTVFAITFGSLGLFRMIESNSEVATRIDSGLANAFTAVYCTINGETTSESASSPSNAVANCATCLVEYLTSCYGKDVTRQKIETSGVGCLLAKSIAPDVASAISASAVGYEALQCIGFARAATVCAGGTLEGRAVAADYINDPPPGFKYVSGTQYCRTGDLGLIDGAVGHIFVWKSGGADGGPVYGIDANYYPVCGSAGCLSTNSPYPPGKVVGCLKKN